MQSSVCIATFNGAAYLEEQLASILAEIGPDDEVVVVDDCSSDQTLSILERTNDPRLRIHRNEVNRGVNQSFERAIGLARGEVIFMSDQDDRWIPGRVQVLTHALERSGALLVASNSLFMDARGQPFDFPVAGVRARDSRRHVSNILGIFTGRTGYYGCAMAFKRQLVELALPMPRFIESHDLWLAMAANVIRANLHVDDNTLVRRIHGANASVIRRGLYWKLRSRIIFGRSLAVLARRAFGSGGTRRRAGYAQ